MLQTLSVQHAATGLLLPGATPAVLDMVSQDAEVYLSDVVRRIREGGLVVKAQIARGDPSTIINRTAEEARADMIVLGTHGKAGMGVSGAGSTAARVSGLSRLPLLLVPIPQTETPDP